MAKMIEKVLLFVIFFSSLGVFIKLKKYGAPNSSFLYAIFLPTAILIFSFIHGFKETKKAYKSGGTSKYKTIKDYITYCVRCIKSLSLLTGVFCVELGKRKIGVKEMLEQGIFKLKKENFDKIYSTILRYINISSITIDKQNLALKNI
jgi:hypothetical protein